MNKLIKINHVLQFCVYVLFILFLSYATYKSMTTSYGRDASGQIVLNGKQDNKKLGEYVSTPVETSNENYLVSYVVNFETDKSSFKNFKSSSSSENDKYTLFLTSDLWGCYRCAISNLKVFNRKTSKSKNLFDEREVIGGFAVQREKDSKKPIKHKLNKIFFSKVDKDYNSDKVLNSIDGYRLYSSDFEGNSKVALSPEGTDVIGYRVDYEFKKIYIQVKQDTNKNFEFDDGDDVVVMAVTLDD
ncbi:hypothetical protein ACRXCV_13000 [Halobacteriovorax sp. GFR7]|uniref:hypothetical protein n=1 Tax=unclassified Halobacteriovorax TaxID=2639665 RepID=UPI003D95B4DF